MEKSRLRVLLAGAGKQVIKDKTGGRGKKGVKKVQREQELAQPCGHSSFWGGEKGPQKKE